MTETRWWKYIEPNLEGMTMRDAAHQAGFNQSAFTRWKSGAKADPEFVVKFARAFNLNVLEALVEAEFITEEEASLTKVEVGGVQLDRATNKQILDEIAKRLVDESGGAFLEEVEVTAPASDLDSRREAKAAAESGEVDDDAIIAGIAAGTEKYAAQKRTPPLEENFT